MIGSHNSMTYLPLSNWWIYPFNWIAKCQSKTIEQQFNLGIRLFDIRISYDKNDNVIFKHGTASYKGDVYNTLKYLNDQNTPIKIRFILETKSEDKHKENLFIKDFQEFTRLFPNLSFYEGRRKFDWKQLVDLPTLEVTQLISSMDGKGIYKICPWLYAIRFNKSNIKSYKGSAPLLLDFID